MREVKQEINTSKPVETFISKTGRVLKERLGKAAIVFGTVAVLGGASAGEVDAQYAPVAPVPTVPSVPVLPPYVPNTNPDAGAYNAGLYVAYSNQARANNCAVYPELCFPPVVISAPVVPAPPIVPVAPALLERRFTSTVVNHVEEIAHLPNGLNLVRGSTQVRPIRAGYERALGSLVPTAPFPVPVYTR